MRITTLCLFILFYLITSNSAFAFEFLGIKSGMTKEEAAEAIKALQGANQSDYYENYFELDKNIKREIEIVPIAVSFRIDHEEKVYQLNAYYSKKYLRSIQILALQKAFLEKYKTELKKHSKDELAAVFQDAEMINKYLQHLTISYKNKI